MSEIDDTIQEYLENTIQEYLEKGYVLDSYEVRGAKQDGETLTLDIVLGFKPLAIIVTLVPDTETKT